MHIWMDFRSLIISFSSLNFIHRYPIWVVMDTNILVGLVTTQHCFHLLRSLLVDFHACSFSCCPYTFDFQYLFLLLTIADFNIKNGTYHLIPWNYTLLQLETSCLKSIYHANQTFIPYIIYNYISYISIDQIGLI